MKIVLRADVANLGKKGDILDVADGHARNYLLPKGLAMKAPSGVESQATAMRRSRDIKDARDREAAETVARTLVPVVIRITAKAGAEGRLFGSGTAGGRGAGSSARGRRGMWWTPGRPRPRSSSTAGACTWRSRSRRSERTGCR